MEKEKSGGIGAWFQNQLALAPLIGNYYIPEETNNFWYSLGGLLAIALGLQFVSGIILLFKYIPDASLAFGIVSEMVHSRFWGTVLGFHYFNAFLIFGLLMLHMGRVFVSAAYRKDKKALWLVGVLLAALVFIEYITGEALHWDEVGFAVPWNVSQLLQAIGLSNALHYNFSDVLSMGTATKQLLQFYVIHIAIVPLTIVVFIILHFYLIKKKGISLPFWKKASGRKVSFGSHIKLWLAYGSFLAGVILLLAVFVGRSAGTAPELLPSSPLYLPAGQEPNDPGDLGFKPTNPIGWTKGMTVIFGQYFGVEPDIWGAAIGMGLMLGGLLIVPFVDNEEKEPTSWKEAFDFRKRKWAFLAMGLFWLVLLAGIIQNIITGAG